MKKRVVHRIVWRKLPPLSPPEMETGMIGEVELWLYCRFDALSCNCDDWRAMYHQIFAEKMGWA